MQIPIFFITCRLHLLFLGLGVIATSCNVVCDAHNLLQKAVQRADELTFYEQRL